MIHQQPGGLAGHLRGSAAQLSPALPPAALAGPAVSLTQHQTGSKHAQHANVLPGSHPGSATAAVAAAPDVSKGDGIGADVSVSNGRVQSTSAEVQKAGGMSWNPVRLSSPFEKASEPTGDWLPLVYHYSSVRPPLPPSRPHPVCSGPLLTHPHPSCPPPPRHWSPLLTTCVLLSQRGCTSIVLCSVSSACSCVYLPALFLPQETPCNQANETKGYSPSEGIMQPSKQKHGLREWFKLAVQFPPLSNHC